MAAGSYEHELMDEVRDARRAVARARIAEADARTAYREAQAERMTKERALEEVLDAITTGDTGRALFDRAARDREAREAEEDAREAARDVMAAKPPTIEVVEDAWTRTPLKSVVKGSDLVALLKGNELLTLGDLYDACSLCGSLSDAIEDLGPTHVAAIDHDVRAWVAKHPGFPLDCLERPEPPPPTHDELVDGLLGEACWPEDASPSWPAIRRDGASNADLLDELREIWADRRVFHARDSTPGYTTLGGESPKFWVGDAFPGGATPIVPTLAGDDLAASVRRILRIPMPEEVDARNAVEQPKPKARKAAQPKKSEAVR